jgi:thiamine biosynthesis lipoprotein ApbE
MSNKMHSGFAARVAGADAGNVIDPQLARPIDIETNLVSLAAREAATAQALAAHLAGADAGTRPTIRLARR